MALPGKVRSRLAAAVDSVLKGVIPPARCRGQWAARYDFEPLERRVLLSNSPAWLAPGSAATWDPNAHVLTVTGPATIIADPGADEPLVTVSGGNASLAIQPQSDAIIHLGGLTLAGGGCAEVARPNAAAFDEAPRAWPTRGRT
jgi:hypothetical protein